jgi:hypothetical protein
MGFSLQKLPTRAAGAQYRPTYPRPVRTIFSLAAVAGDTLRAEHVRKDSAAGPGRWQARRARGKVRLPMKSRTGSILASLTNGRPPRRSPTPLSRFSAPNFALFTKGMIVFAFPDTARPPHGAAGRHVMRRKFSLSFLFRFRMGFVLASASGSEAFSIYGSATVGGLKSFRKRLAFGRA